MTLLGPTPARSVTSRAIPLSMLLLAACGTENKLNNVSDNPGGDGVPAIDVSPDNLNFGSLGEGEVATMTFTVSNVGAEGSILNVSGIDLSGTGAESFTILTAPLDFSLEVGGAGQTIDVAFTPLGAEPTAQALVHSDDPEMPHSVVELSGAGAVPELQITPDPLDMGTTYIGCEKSNVVTLTNVGNDTLDISDITEAGGGGTITISSMGGLPISLEPGDSTEVGLLFSPERVDTYNATLTVTSNEPRGVRTAEQTAEGKYGQDYTDAFEVDANPPADILFFVDQSCSMDDDARSLASNFSDFISQLSVYTSDWHVMVVNDDDGCSGSGVLTSATASYETKFTSAVSAGGGLWTEAGLTVTSSAVDKTDGSECNAGFLRSDALLHIIMVSDETEQSWGTWDSYVNQVIAKKGDASKVKFSAIAGDYPSGCSSGTNSADFGRGYYEAALDTSGLFLSICSNWSTNVSALADASITETNFPLTRSPDPSTITVDVNGSPEGGWTYDSATNSVVFNDANACEGGDLIEVSYSALATCD